MLKRQYQIRRKLQRWRDLQLEAFGMRRLFKKKYILGRINPGILTIKARLRD